VGWARAVVSEDKQDIETAFSRMQKFREMVAKAKRYKVRFFFFFVLF
jgi:hypothetical protein